MRNKPNSRGSRQGYPRASDRKTRRHPEAGPLAIGRPLDPETGTAGNGGIGKRDNPPVSQDLGRTPVMEEEQEIPAPKSDGTKPIGFLPLVSILQTINVDPLVPDDAKQTQFRGGGCGYLAGRWSPERPAGYWVGDDPVGPARRIGRYPMAMPTIEAGRGMGAESERPGETG